MMILPRWTIAIDLIEDVRSSIAMYMFILEETAQTLGMSCYLLSRNEEYERLIEMANYAINELINPAIEFVETYGALAYPLHFAYKAFFEGAKRTFQTYLYVAQKKLQTR